VGDDVLSMRERRADDVRVQVVRRGVVDDVNVGIGDQPFETAVRLRDAELLRLRARRSLTARRDRDDVDEAEAPNRIDVMNPDEPRADEAHPYTFHMCQGRRQMADGITRVLPVRTPDTSSLRRSSCPALDIHTRYRRGSATALSSRAGAPL